MVQAKPLPTPGIPGTPGHDAFRELVSEDAKSRHDDRITPSERAWLRSEEIAPSWLASLKELQQDLQGQFAESNAELAEKQQECFARGYAGKQDWLRYKADEARWRAGAKRYFNALSTRVEEAKLVLESRRRAERVVTEAFQRQRKLLKQALPYVVQEDPELEEQIQEVLGRRHPKNGQA